MESYLLCNIRENQKTITLKAEKLVMYLQSKWIEAFDENGHVYYLLFYKNDYLTWMKPVCQNRHSHLEQSFKKGMTFPAPHPFLVNLLSTKEAFPKVAVSHLPEKLQKSYTPHETSLILTFLDSFESKESIFKPIQSIYYKYRRNGQMFAGYRIIRILQDFMPEHSWVKDIASSFEFEKYNSMYHLVSEELMEKDPLFSEKSLFKSAEEEDSFRLLELMKKENRLLDHTALSLEAYRKFKSLSSYTLMKSLLEDAFSVTEQIYIIEELKGISDKNNHILQDLLHLYLKENEVEKLCNLIAQDAITLTVEQRNSFENMLLTMDFKENRVQVEKLNSYLLPILNANSLKASELLLNCVSRLLSEYDISYVMEWLEPLKPNEEAGKLYYTFEKMSRLVDDPDQQFLLGELYYEFQRFDAAIDCFSWQMELDKTDPKPVQWLSKIYLETGKEDESKAYQQLYQEMSKEA
ncbi:hypothetical protein [Bacillus sp. FJAT-44742]|uniref:hypothetical protein n=1 Tax=Bacillus sp. FJAT-44742 TaxID=2014005 RepID=UPI000C2334E4|nr:hypothetical protein [Bacillus sp. FJAT-44742]